MKAKEQHVDLHQSKIKKNSNNTNEISESFKKLTNSEKLNRINGAVNLLQQFKQIQVAENQVCHHSHADFLIKRVFFRLE